MKRIGILIALIGVAAAAAPISNTAKNSMIIKEGQRVTSEKLKDPTSAQFRNIIIHRDTDDPKTETYFVCGEVNAKNAFGGYVGFRPFWSAVLWTKKTNGQPVAFGALGYPAETDETVGDPLYTLRKQHCENSD